MGFLGEQQLKTSNMELNKHHRQSLLNELEKAEQAKELNDRCMRSEGIDTELQHWREMEDFLIKARIELIKKSIIDNEIDY